MDEQGQTQEQMEGQTDGQSADTLELDTYQNNVISSLGNLQILHSVELFLIFAVIGCLVGKQMWDKVRL